MEYGQNAMKGGYPMQGPVGGPGINYDHRAQDKAAIAGQMAPVPNRASEQMFHELAQRFALLGELIARLEGLADRATGPVPQDPKVQGGMHSPNNLNEKISCSVQIVDEANTRILSALQRLESFV